MQPRPNVPHRPRRSAVFQSLATLAAGLVLSMPVSAQFGGSAMGAMGGMGRGGRNDRPPIGTGDGAGAAREGAVDPTQELVRVEAELGRLQQALRLAGLCRPRARTGRRSRA